ncbi:MAG: M81 family metallopeptidase [Alphaproteobacteria bacterium]
MARIAIGGFQHETNTFAPTKADFRVFEQADGWPGLTRGPALFDAVAGINLPVAGFVDALKGTGHAIEPLLWCSAPPAAHVTTGAFERIAAMLCDGLARLRGLDAVYLDLHGAMVTEDHEDGEGEILRRVRAVVGEETPVVASLDLHANVTEAMMARASALVAFRTYPHIDMAETGGRAARLLLDMLARGRAPAKAMRKLDFFIPITVQCTMFDPAKTIYERLAEIDTGSVASLSYTQGFPPADIRENGPAVMAYGWDGESACRAADTLYGEVAGQEGDFRLEIHDVEAAVERALANGSANPVILADTQDNPGAGANGDTTWIIEALVRRDAQDAVVATVFDPETAAQAHAAGEGAVIEARLGARSGLTGHRPFERRMVVEKITDGRFTGTGPMWRGARIDLGPMARLRPAEAPGTGVRVLVSSRKLQAGDRSILRHMGIEPAGQRIIALKSSVHFRADFQSIAAEVLVVRAPGPNPADPSELPYRRLRDGVRLNPLGPPFRRPK